MKRVIVGLSGGVDSAVAAYLLKLAGYDVIGVTLRTWVSADGKESRCCEIDDAREVSAQLGIPYYAVNCQADFRRYITEPFVSEYVSGRTPNPCIICNRAIKWDKMLEFADVMQADLIATGHYACVERLPNGRFTVRQADHTEKDQTYMLYRLTQQQLARTMMPLGRLSKQEVRGIAEKAGLSVADKPDSQEICFVPDGDYIGYIEEHAETLPPEGSFVDTSGKVLGTHGGIHRYTVGQRKGLGLSLGYPAYVRELDSASNTVVIGDENSLYSSQIRCSDAVFMGMEEPSVGERFSGLAKIRYHHSPQPAEAELLPDCTLSLTFRTPVRAAARGQSAVLYSENGSVLCGGVIM